VHCCSGTDLKSFLAEYQQYPAIGINWISFGPNGRQKRPPKPGVLRWYTQCHPEPNKHIKVIANTRWIATIGSYHPHNFWYKYALVTCKFVWSSLLQHPKEPFSWSKSRIETTSKSDICSNSKFPYIYLACSLFSFWRYCTETTIK
jgi:hypothetical protein